MFAYIAFFVKRLILHINISAWYKQNDLALCAPVTLLCATVWCSLCTVLMPWRREARQPVASNFYYFSEIKQARPIEMQMEVVKEVKCSYRTWHRTAWTPSYPRPSRGRSGDPRKHGRRRPSLRGNSVRSPRAHCTRWTCPRHQHTDRTWTIAKCYEYVHCKYKRKMHNRRRGASIYAYVYTRMQTSRQIRRHVSTFAKEESSMQTRKPA